MKYTRKSLSHPISQLIDFKYDVHEQSEYSELYGLVQLSNPVQ